MTAAEWQRRQARILEWRRLGSGFAVMLLCVLIALACGGCNSTALKQGDEIFHDGSFAENAQLDVLKLEKPGGFKLTRIRVGKDQQTALNRYLLMKGLPAILDKGGEALSGLTDSVADGVKAVSE